MRARRREWESEGGGMDYDTCTHCFTRMHGCIEEFSNRCSPRCFCLSGFLLYPLAARLACLCTIIQSTCTVLMSSGLLFTDLFQESFQAPEEREEGSS